MSTAIKSSVPASTRSLSFTADGNRSSMRVAFEGQNSGGVSGSDATVPRADFLAAVETECEVRVVAADAIVIERAELPEVCVDTSGLPCIPGVTPEIRTQSAEKARFLAACWLALAEYLDAHPPTPPVDEADVGALAGLVDEAGVRAVANASSRLIARRLLATGRVSVTR